MVLTLDLRHHLGLASGVRLLTHPQIEELLHTVVVGITPLLLLLDVVRLHLGKILLERDHFLGSLVEQATAVSEVLLLLLGTPLRLQRVQLEVLHLVGQLDELVCKVVILGVPQVVQQSLLFLGLDLPLVQHVERTDAFLTLLEVDLFELVALLSQLGARAMQVLRLRLVEEHVAGILDLLPESLVLDPEALHLLLGVYEVVLPVVEVLLEQHCVAHQLVALVQLGLVLLVDGGLVPARQHNHVVHLGHLLVVEAFGLQVAQRLHERLVLVLAALVHELQGLHLLSHHGLHVLQAEERGASLGCLTSQTSVVLRHLLSLVLRDHLGLVALRLFDQIERLEVLVTVVGVARAQLIVVPLQVVVLLHRHRVLLIIHL